MKHPDASVVRQMAFVLKRSYLFPGFLVSDRPFVVVKGASNEQSRMRKNEPKKGRQDWLFQKWQEMISTVVSVSSRFA
jgi:hypothetical protein